MKVIDNKGVNVTVKCFECWQITINSILQLWERLKCYNFLCLYTRRINQDCVKNFFGSIRLQGGNSVNPTPIQFIRAFKKLFSMKALQHSNEQNCEQDTDVMFSLIGEPCSNLSVTPSINVSTSTNNILDIPTHDYYDIEFPEQNAFKYVCGYLIKKCTERHACEVCSAFMKENNADLDNTTIYCSFRAYNTDEVPFGKLNIASNNFYSYIQQLEQIFVTNFESNCFQANIGSYLFKLAQNVDFKAPCPEFPKIYLLKLFLRMRIYFTLSHHNKECGSMKKKNRKMFNILHL